MRSPTWAFSPPFPAIMLLSAMSPGRKCARLPAMTGRLRTSASGPGVTASPEALSSPAAGTSTVVGVSPMAVATPRLAATSASAPGARPGPGAEIASSATSRWRPWTTAAWVPVASIR